MASGDITRSTTAITTISRLHSNADGVAEAFGEFDTGSTGAIAVSIHLVIPINASATGGSYDIYLLESHDAAEWTDNIDPASTGDIAAKLSDAKLIKTIDTTYDGTNRTEAEVYISLNMMGRPRYIGLVCDNNSLQTIPASGADGDYIDIKVS